MEQPNIRIPRYPDYTRVRKFLPLMMGQQYQIFESMNNNQAAFEPGVAPITLIDGDRLINLLIENSIGVHKDSLTLLKFEPSDFIFEDETQEI